MSSHAMHWNHEAIRQAVVADDVPALKAALTKLPLQKNKKGEGKEHRQSLSEAAQSALDAEAAAEKVVADRLAAEYESLMGLGSSLSTAPARLLNLEDPATLRGVIMSCYLSEVEEEDKSAKPAAGSVAATTRPLSAARLRLQQARSIPLPADSHTEAKKKTLPLGIAHIAAANDRYNVLEWCLQAAPEALHWAADTCQWTPLHFAAFNQHERSCALLRHFGADLDIEDAYGDTAGDVSAQIGASDKILGVLGEAIDNEEDYEEEEEEERVDESPEKSRAASDASGGSPLHGAIKPIHGVSSSAAISHLAIEGVGITTGGEATDAQRLLEAGNVRRLRMQRRRREAKRKQKSIAEEALLAEAKSYEEELKAKKLMEELERKEAEERRQERKALVAKRREKRNQFETIRLEMILDWLQARQRLAFDVLCDRESLFRANGLQYYYDNMIEPALQYNQQWWRQKKSAEDKAAKEAQIAAEKARKKKRGKKRTGSAGSKKASSPSTSPGQPGLRLRRNSGSNEANSPEPLTLSEGNDMPPPTPSHYQLVFHGLSFAPEEDFPIPEALLPGSRVFLNKQDKTRLMRQKAASLRRRKDNKELLAAAHYRLETIKEEELAVLESIEAVARKQLFALWLCEAATYVYFPFEPSLDRTHHDANTGKLGRFMYNVETESYRWSCCGQKGDPCAPGCVAAADELRPPFHPGSFKYHHEDGSCCWHLLTPEEKRAAKNKLGQLRGFGSTVSGDSDMRASARGGSSKQPGDSSSDDDTASVNTVDAVAKHARHSSLETARRSSQYASGTATKNIVPYLHNSRSAGKLMLKHPNCNPGAYSWTCCGDHNEDADGCTARRRLIYFRHNLLSAPFSVLHLPTCLEDRERIYLNQKYPQKVGSEGHPAIDRSGSHSQRPGSPLDKLSQSKRAYVLRMQAKESRRESNTAFRSTGFGEDGDVAPASKAIPLPLLRAPSTADWRNAFSVNDNDVEEEKPRKPLANPPSGKKGALIGKGGRKISDDAHQLPSESQLSEQAARETDRRQKIFSTLRRQVVQSAGLGTNAHQRNTFLKNWNFSAKKATGPEEDDDDELNAAYGKPLPVPDTPRVRPVTTGELLQKRNTDKTQSSVKKSALAQSSPAQNHVQRAAKNAGTYLQKMKFRKQADRSLVLVLQDGSPSLDNTKGTEATTLPRPAAVVSVLEFTLCGRTVRHFGKRSFIYDSPQPTTIEEGALDTKSTAPDQPLAVVAAPPPGTIGTATLQSNTTRTNIYGALAVQPYSLYEHVYLENKRRAALTARSVKVATANTLERSAFGWGAKSQSMSVNEDSPKMAPTAADAFPSSPKRGTTAYTNNGLNVSLIMDIDDGTIDLDPADDKNHTSGLKGSLQAKKKLSFEDKVDPLNDADHEEKQDEDTSPHGDASVALDAGKAGKDDIEGTMAREYARSNPLAPQTSSEYLRQTQIAGQIGGSGNTAQTSKNTLAEARSSTEGLETDQKAVAALSEEAAAASLAQKNSGGHQPFGSSQLLYRPLRSNVVAFEFVINKCPVSVVSHQIGTSRGSAAKVVESREQMVIGLCLRDLWWLGKDDWLRSRRGCGKKRDAFGSAGSDSDEVDFYEDDEVGDAPRQGSVYGASPFVKAPSAAARRQSIQHGGGKNGKLGGLPPRSRAARKSSFGIPLGGGADDIDEPLPPGAAAAPTAPTLSSRVLFEMAMKKLWDDSVAEDRLAQMKRRGSIIPNSEGGASLVPSATVTAAPSSSQQPGEAKLLPLPPLFSYIDPTHSRDRLRSASAPARGPASASGGSKSYADHSLLPGPVASIVLVDGSDDLVPPNVFYRKNFYDPDAPVMTKPSIDDNAEDPEVASGGKGRRALFNDGVARRRRSTITGLSGVPTSLSQAQRQAPQSYALATPVSVPEFMTKHNLSAATGGDARPDDSIPVRPSLLKSVLSKIVGVPAESEEDQHQKRRSVASGALQPQTLSASALQSASFLGGGVGGRGAVRPPSAISTIDSITTDNNSVASFTDNLRDATPVQPQPQSALEADVDRQTQVYEKELEALQVAMASQCSIGWWAHSTHIRGLGGMVSVEAKEPYGKDNDNVAIVVDGPNNSVFFFKNRVLMATVSLPTRQSSANKQREPAAELQRRNMRDKRFNKDARKARRQRINDEKQPQQHSSYGGGPLKWGLDSTMSPDALADLESLSDSSNSQSDGFSDFAGGSSKPLHSDKNDLLDLTSASSTSSGSEGDLDRRRSERARSIAARTAAVSFLGHRKQNFTPQQLFTAIEKRLDPKPAESMRLLNPLPPTPAPAEAVATPSAGRITPTTSIKKPLMVSSGSTSPLKESLTGPPPTPQPQQEPKKVRSIDFAYARPSFISPFLSDLARTTVLNSSVIAAQKRSWRQGDAKGESRARALTARPTTSLTGGAAGEAAHHTTLLDAQKLAMCYMFSGMKELATEPTDNDGAVRVDNPDTDGAVQGGGANGKVLQLVSGGGLVVARKAATEAPRTELLRFKPSASRGLDSPLSPITEGEETNTDADALERERISVAEKKFADTLLMYEQNPRFRALSGTASGRLMSLLLALHGLDSTHKHSPAALPELYGSHDGTSNPEQHTIPLKRWRRVQGYNNQVWVPVVTLVEGCSISAEPTYGRPWLAYVDGHFKSRAAAERIYRLGYYETLKPENSRAASAASSQARFLTATTAKATNSNPAAAGQPVRTGQFLARLNSLANIAREVQEQRLRKEGKLGRSSSAASSVKSVANALSSPTHAPSPVRNGISAAWQAAAAAIGPRKSVVTMRNKARSVRSASYNQNDDSDSDDGRMYF